MTLEQLWSTLEAWPLAAHIGETWWFPLLESLHVLTVALVVGSILMLDLRLLGLAARNQPVRRLAREILGWTWATFALALITGVGMFITRASHYAANPAFQIKIVLLLLAALNVLAFHRLTARGIDRWDTATTLPRPARFAGGCSLALWIAVMLAGRWIGHLS
jgi:hypothetical protein